MKGFHTLMRLAHLLNTLALHQVALWPTVQAKGIGPDSLDLSNLCWELAGYGCHRRASESAPLPTAGLVERRRLLTQLRLLSSGASAAFSQNSARMGTAIPCGQPRQLDGPTPLFDRDRRDLEMVGTTE